MARLVANTKLLSTLLANKASILGTRRGYAVATQGITSGSCAMRGGSVMGAKKEVEEPTSPWVPDPVTGYYRPENHGNDVNVAEQHELLLKNKITTCQ